MQRTIPEDSVTGMKRSMMAKHGVSVSAVQQNIRITEVIKKIR